MGSIYLDPPTLYLLGSLNKNPNQVTIPNPKRNYMEGPGRSPKQNSQVLTTAHVGAVQLRPLHRACPKPASEGLEFRV